MKVLVLMAGNNPDDIDGSYPFYMTEINGKMILEHHIEYYNNFKPTQIIFCLKQEDIKRYHVDHVIKQCTENAVFVSVNGKTAGSVCTALLACEHIINDEELVIVAINDSIDKEGLEILNKFRNKKADAGVVSFKSVHPRYSFIVTDDDHFVSEVAEKQPISKQALASFYYFKSGKDFVDAAKQVIRKDNKINNSFYISQTLNELILKQKKIDVFSIPNEMFHPVKSEIQLAQYISNLNDVKESK